MAASDKELELYLMEAGNRLVEPPSSADELILLLDHLESCLSRVEQSPSQSMQNALSSSLKALVAEQLFRHPDDDVKVAVAACISEITRITAPHAPYDDDLMKEVFQLIVSSFENLSDKSSCSFLKRTSILETVAKVRSCVVMLDLECDALIIEMFHHFFKAIRDYHAEVVFTSMLTIMTLVLEESEDISVELLSPILAIVKKDNEEVLPVARRLAERVLENCALKLKPYLMLAVENLGISFDNYSSVVASICQVKPAAVEQNDVSTDKHVQEDNEIPKETVSTEQVDLANEKSTKSVVGNGVVQTAEGDSLADSNSLKKQEDDHLAGKSENADTLTVAEHDRLEAEKVANSDSKSEQSTQEKGRKSDLKTTEPSDSCHVDEKEAETLMDPKNDSKGDACSPRKDPSIDEIVPSENKREIDVQPSSPKATEGESSSVSPTSSGTIPDEIHSKRATRPKRKESLSKESTPSVDVSKKASEGTSDSKAKTNRQSGKNVATVVSKEDNVPADVDETKKESGTASDSEAKTLKDSSKKADSSSNNIDGSSSKQMEDEERRARGKAVPKKDEETIASPKSVKPNKHDSYVEETPNTNSKKKQIRSEEKASDSMVYGENLVGLKVKVWWPKDRMFYEGVIHSFDSVRKKHKVIYIDGDEEILNLRREKWELIENDSGSDEEEAADHPCPDSSSEMGGGALSGKSKGIGTKSGRKTKEDGKVDGKSKDGFKGVSKSDNENVTKAKDHTPKSGNKSVDIASKVVSSDTPMSTKFKDEGSLTPKASAKSKQGTSKTAKSKQETPKISSKSKGKPLKSGKSNANGTGKSKLGLSKVKESESMKENSTDSAKVVESAKRKSPSLSMAEGSDSNSGKKQRR